MLLKREGQADMMSWREKLEVFLKDFEHQDQIVGVLAFGSYITGRPLPHSDLDVYIVLDDRVSFEEKGSRVVGGLLVEYYAKPLRLINKELDQHFESRALITQNIFAIGEIIFDKAGAVKALKERSKTMLEGFYNREDSPLPEDEKAYFCDMLYDLKDGVDKPHFDFMYFNSLDRMLEEYMRCINRPYRFKTMLDGIVDRDFAKKNLLKEMPHKDITDMIADAIIAKTNEEKIEKFEELAWGIINKFGGFDIGSFTVRKEV